MPDLTAPSGLWLGGLLLPLVLMYVLRSKQQRLTVSSTWLWQHARRDLEAAHPLRRLRREVPLLLEALLLVALALAAAGPVSVDLGLRGEPTAIVVDVTASMSAREGDATRLDIARARAREILKHMLPGTPAVLLEAGAAPRVVSPLGTDRRGLAQAIDALSVRDEPGELQKAVTLASERLAVAGDPGRVVVVTDGGGRATAVGSSTLELMRVGGSHGNVGVVEAVARAATGAASKRGIEVQATVRSHSTRPESRYATLRRKGSPEPVASRHIDVPPGATESFTLSFERAGSEVGIGLVLELSPGDALATDDRAHLVMPPPTALPVVLTSAVGAPWVERALAADDEVDASRAPIGFEPPVGALWVADGHCPHHRHLGDVVVLRPPPGPCLGLDVGERVPDDAVTSWDPHDPRLRFVDLDGLVGRGARRLGRLSPGDALVRARSGVLVASADASGRHGTVVAFDAERSGWPRDASFVVFLRNVTELARESRAASVGVQALAGSALRIAVPAGVSAVRLEDPSGASQRLPVLDGLAVAPAPPRAGFHFVHWGGPAAGSKLVAVNLGSTAESDLASRPEGASGVAGAEIQSASFPRSAAWLLGITALLLVLADAVWLCRGRPRPTLGALWRRPAVLLTTLGGAALLGLALAEIAGLLPPERAPLGFERPWVLLVAPLLPPALARLIGAQARGWSPTRRTLSELVGGLLALAALGIASGLESGVAVDRVAVIVAIDRSRSIDHVDGAESRLAAELRVAETSMRDQDRLGRIVFGADAHVEEPLRTRGETRSAQRVDVERDGTDLEAAITRALAEVPRDAATRIALVSDGVATRGDGLRAAAAARVAGVPVDVVPLDQRVVENLRIRDIRSPTRATVGEPVELRVVTQASRATEIEFRIYRDDVLLRSGATTVREGEDVVWFSDVATEPGLRRYDVEVTATDAAADAVATDNRSSTFVSVDGAAQTLLIARGGQAPPIAAALEQAGFVVTTVAASGAPADVAALASYDLVVLGDVPARLLAESQLDALGSFVEDVGGGLLLLGGADAFGPGGYGQTAVERVSPVSFDLKQDRRRGTLAEVIAIDNSGSMTQRAGTRTKIDLANEAAVRSVALLGDGDRVGVMHVDTAVSWTVPLGAPDLDGMARAVRAVGAGGGGIFVDTALRAAYEAVAREHTTLRHVLLFSDGADAEERASAPTLVADAGRRGITTSVVALGKGTDVPALEQLSRLGSGRFYLIEHAGRLPAVFAQETIAASRSAVLEERFVPRRAAPARYLRGVPLNAPPPLGGRVVTIAKARSVVALAGPEADPILATWAVGLGRTAAFTSDFGGRWGASWSAWPGATQLFAQLGRYLARERRAQGVSVLSRIERGELYVRATTTREGSVGPSTPLLAVVAGPDGRHDQLSLRPSVAGVHEARLPLSRAGSYVVTVVEAGSSRPLATSAVAHRGAQERTPTGSDRDLLTRVAASSGGRVRDTLAGVFEDRGTRRWLHEPRTASLAWLGAALTLCLVALRKLTLPTAIVRVVAALARGWPPPTPAEATRPSVGTAGALLRVKRRRHEEVLPSPTDAEPLDPAPPDPTPLDAASRPPEARGAEEPLRAETEALSAAEILARRRRKR